MQNQQPNLQSCYGIVIDGDKFQATTMAQVKEVCRLMFLSIDLSLDKAKQVLHRIETDKSFNISNLKALLQQQIDERVSFLKKSGAQVSLLERLDEWTTVFDVPKDSELNELIELYGISDEEFFKLKKLKLLKKIHGPADIKGILDEYVIGQEEAKKAISFAFYLHLLRINQLVPCIYKLTKASRLNQETDLPRPNIMLIGPTGSGKTFILSQLCNEFEIPFLRIDCASLVASGYVGNNLNDSLFQLLRAVDFNVDKAATAIIYFDEFDKISESQTHSRGSVGGVELQQEFLSFIENKELLIKPPRDAREEKAYLIPAKNLMFAFSGSFAGMEPLIKKRLNIKDVVVERVGFKRGGQAIEGIKTLEEPLLATVHQDLIDFGMIPELVGRVNFIVPLHKLTKDDIINIIKNSKLSPLKLYSNFFYVHYDELIIEEEVYGLLADEVLKKGTGARAILSVLHNLLKEHMYESPDNEFKKYIISPAYFQQVITK